MTTAEATMTMINRLSEPNLRKVQRYVERIFVRQQDRETFQLRPYTEEEFISLIDKSLEDSKAGRTYTPEQVEEMARKKYGL
ncbi:hypothetical protein IJ090_02240 [Candidatus Saccharibacteria bacterium]|nr:hypothetical protein [Candidatus Saccharibacteria bacterium]